MASSVDPFSSVLPSLAYSATVSPVSQLTSALTMLSFSLATAVLTLSTAVAGAVVQKRGCTGYVPASDVFSLGQSQQ